MTLKYCIRKISSWRVNGPWLALAVGSIGVAASIAAWIVVFQLEARNDARELAAQAANSTLVFQTGMNERLNRITAVRAFFDASTEITRSEFDRFARDLLKGRPAMTAISWFPRITREEREAHEFSAVRAGIDHYTIKSVGSDGRLHPAPDKSEYFPLYYTAINTTGIDRVVKVYGLDLADGAMREQTMAAARDGDRLATSEEIQLRTGEGDLSDLFILAPIYRDGLRSQSISDRRRNLVGFVQVVFQISLMVDRILGSLESPVDFYFFYGNTEAAPIYVHRSSLRGATRPKSLVDVRSGKYIETEVAVADKKIKLIVVPYPEGTFAAHPRAWIILLAGLILSAGMAAYVWASRRHTQSLTVLARRDSLTGLANRGVLLQRLTEEHGSSSTPFATLFVDLDYFRDVNDGLGHPIGDGVLVQVADRLSRLVPENGMVARFGGDEFAFLVTDTDVAAVGELADKILRILARPYVIDDNEIRITASVGIALSLAPNQSDANSSVVQADLALYRAKEDGRNCFRFHNKELDDAYQDRVLLGADLRIGIERNEFLLYYQPQVELRSGRIVGLEALVRWQHPKRGFISPAQFIPIAERTGAIFALGKWVFDEACRQTKVWQDEGIAPQFVGVNISAVQFRSLDLENDMDSALDRYGIERGRIEIELTETVLMDVAQHNPHLIQRFRDRGLRVALDDFGTGYSSLNYLTKYQVDRLKIAQELVLGVAVETRNAMVVKTAIRLAEELGIEIVAEGVEGPEQVNFLIAAGCGYAQGYYFSRPVPVDSATQLLRQEKITPERKHSPLELIKTSDGN